MAGELTARQVRDLKAQAQHLEPIVRVGRSGLASAVLATVEQALAHRELIKVRFDQDRPVRDELARELARQTCSRLIMQVGKVAIYHRARPADPDKSNEAGSAGPVRDQQ